MTALRPSLALFSVLLAACGDKGDTTMTTDATTTAATTTAAATTDATTTAAPTSAGTTTDAETTAKTTTDADTTAAPTSSGGCEGDCGIAVEMGSSLCDDTDPNMIPPSLMASSPAVGTIAVVEAGYETSCCLTLEPSAAVDGTTITVSYTETGEPCDCICYYTIDFMLTGVASGNWSVKSGAQTAYVEVL